MNRMNHAGRSCLRWLAVAGATTAVASAQMDQEKEPTVKSEIKATPDVLAAPAEGTYFEQGNFFQALDRYLGDGTLDADFGIAGNYNDEGGTDTSLVWGYAEAGYTTPSFNGLDFGGSLIFAQQIAQHNKGYSNAFEKDAALQSLFARYTFPESEATILGGRKKFNKTAITDGDSHEGMEVSTGSLIPNLEVSGAWVGRWVNNSTISNDGDGIEDWQKVNTASDGEAGNAAFWGQATLNLDLLNSSSVTPFLQYQKKVGTGVGAEAEVATALGETDLILGGTYAYFDNDIPNSVNPNLESASQFIVTATLDFGRTYLTGGYWGQENKDADISEGIFDTFDPGELGDLAGRSAEIPFVEAGIGLTDTINLSGMVLYADNSHLNQKSWEFDVYLEWSLSENLSLEGYYAYIDFDKSTANGESYKDYGQGGASLNYSF